MLEADVRGATFRVEGLTPVWECETGEDGRGPSLFTCHAGSIIKVFVCVCVCHACVGV